MTYSYGTLPRRLPTARRAAQLDRGTPLGCGVCGVAATMPKAQQPPAAAAAAAAVGSAAAATGDAAESGAPGGLVWQPLPRVHVDDLPYERFLREFALPKQPFILEGASVGWAAAHRWPDLSYLAERVDPKQKVSYTTCKAPYEPEQEEEKRIAVGEALKRLRPPPLLDLAGLVFQDLEGPEPEPEPELPVRYIKTWDYVRGGGAKLQEDFTVPSIFDRSAEAISKQVVLGHSETDMKCVSKAISLSLSFCIRNLSHVTHFMADLGPFLAQVVVHW